jgi:hypothetical protein
MVSKKHNSVYREVVAITSVYLGPAADRFITRQVQNHLQKEPNELSRQDLVKLSAWMQVALSMITEDQRLVEEYMAQLQELIKRPQKNNA